jgi:predicted nucleic acid-binding protein
MKIAVTDTSVFIDLFAADLVCVFFELPYELHTTIEILNELFEEQQAILLEFIKPMKLKVYELKEEEWDAGNELNFVKGLSLPDRSALIYANSLKAIVLSGDMAIRKKAKQLGLEYHGILWVFEQLVDHKLISKETAKEKLQVLIDHNLLYKNSFQMQKVFKEMDSRWSN